MLSYIKNNPDWKALALENTSESRKMLLELINEPIIQQTNSTDVGFRGITHTYGPEFAATILGKLDAASTKNPLLKATYNAITTTGIDFSNPVTQGQLTALQQTGVFSPEETTKLKAIGSWQVGTAKSVTGSDATIEQITEWCNVLVKEVWQIRLATVYNRVTQTIESSSPEEIDQLTWSDIHSAFESE